MDECPKIINAKEFGESWKVWWGSLQPVWRNFSWPPTQAVNSTGRDWAALCRGGPNGVVLALIGLGWWVAAGNEAGQADEARLALADVQWAVKNMSNYKRPHAGEAGNLSKQRRVGN